MCYPEDKVKRKVVIMLYPVMQKRRSSAKSLWWYQEFIEGLEIQTRSIIYVSKEFYLLLVIWKGLNNKKC